MTIRHYEGEWLDVLLFIYAADEQVDSRPGTRGARLAKADTAERIASLEAAVELLHEGLDYHTGCLVELEQEFAKPFPDKAALFTLMGDVDPTTGITSNLPDIRADLRRWMARSKAADRRALAAWLPVLNAVHARLDDMCERFLLIRRQIHVKFGKAESEAAYYAVLDRHLRSIGETEFADMLKRKEQL